MSVTTVGSGAPAAVATATVVTGDQRRATDPASSAWVSASAGAGKTSLLVDRVARLLLTGTQPQRIQCLTYTKAAAAEMRTRIARTLGQWATATDAELRVALDELTGDAPDEDRLRHARRLFAVVLDAPGGLRIDTIHAFCQSVLKRFPVEAGLAPHFEVVDERDAGELVAAAQRDLLRDVQRGAADLALPGALAEVSRFLGEDEFPALIAGLVRDKQRLETWLDGRDAAGIESAARKALGLGADADEAAILAEAEQVNEVRDAGLRRAAKAMAEGSKTDQEHGALILDWLGADDRAGLFDAYLGAFFRDKGKGDRFKTLVHKDALAAAPNADDVLAREAARLDVVRERLKALRAARATAALLLLARGVLERFEALKADRALVDYDDLIAGTLALLKRAQTGAVAWVLYKLDGGIDHLLVDEAQDTSPPQWELIELLTGEFFAGDGVETDGVRTVFVVGDTKQSIYSFQGASPESFGKFRDEFHRRAEEVGRDFEQVALHLSYRSTEAVLEAVDLVFARDDARGGVGEPGEAISHEAYRKGLAGHVEVWPLVFHDELGEEEVWAPPAPRAASAHPRLLLARRIAETIAGWVNGTERLISENRRIRPRDVMVLVRQRGVFVSELVAELKKRGVEVAGVDRIKLLEQLVVKDLIALGRFLLLPDDELTLAAVLKSPFCGLDDELLFTVAHGRGRDSLWRSLGKRIGKDPRIASAHALLTDLLSNTDYAPPYELFGDLLDAEGGRAKVLARLGREAGDPIDEFLSLALAYQRGHTSSLEGFLHWLEAGETEVKRDLGHDVRDEVRVMTVHGAKGLEAPIVFLPDTTSTPDRVAPVLWPGRGEDLAGPPVWMPRRVLAPAIAERRRGDALARMHAEHRRLLYVAMTRAKDRLYVCGWANKRGPSAGCWYELVTRGLPGDAAAEMDFGDEWRGRGWVVASGGAGQSPARTGPKPRIQKPLPEWIAADPPPEPTPSRPLAPSRPDEGEPPVISPFEPDDAYRYRRGLLIHRLLETLPALAHHARAPAAERYLARAEHELPRETQQQILNETLAVVANPETDFLFGEEAMAEVPVTGVVAGSVYSGQIDRLAVTADAVWIVDYKTNRPAPAHERDVAAAYLRQMAAYRALVSSIYPEKTVICALLWTDGPHLMRLSDEVLDAYAPGKEQKPN